MRRLGQWSELETYLNDKIRSLGQSPRLRIEFGWLRLAQGESGKADAAFQDAFRLDRSSQQALFGRVIALRPHTRTSRTPSMSAISLGPTARRSGSLISGR